MSNPQSPIEKHQDYSPDAATYSALVQSLPTVADPEELAAAALLALDGGSISDRATVLRDLTRRVDALTSADGSERLRVLAAQVPILERLGTHWMVKAARATTPQSQQTFLSMALGCQKNLARLLLVIDTLQANANTIKV